MSLLEENNPFRPCQLEISQDISDISALGEDSIHQFSRTQLQRHSLARERAGKNKKENEPEGKVEATISEDVADGQTALLDAALKVLRNDELQLLVPSDELDDDEIHIIETTVNESNHALQDYQMQLMLLEQQNKKRLLKARQVQAAKEEENTKAQISRVGTLRYQELLAQMETQGAERFTLDYKETQFGPGVPRKPRDEGIATMAKKQKQDNHSQGQAHQTTSEHIMNGKNLDTAGGNEVNDNGLPLYFDIIYKISCSEINSPNHPVPAFRDSPIPDELMGFKNQDSFSAVSHLNGRIPILNLEAFMEEDTDNIALVIIRTVQCSAASVLLARSGVPPEWTESVYMKSKIVKNAMQQIATCYFQPIVSGQDDYFPHIASSPHPYESLSYEHNRIEPVDLFHFHHHRLLNNYTLKHPESKQHIGAFSHYMDNRYRTEFAEAESLFARGLVTPAHILKLFKPNELVVSGTYGRPAAFVVQEWPNLKDGWVTITCWSFQTDGSRFARKQTILSIPPIGSEPKDIKTLTAYPLRYAAPEVQESIRAQGKKQWELRNATQVTYRGENVKRDQYFPEARFMIDHRIYHKMHEHAAAFRFNKPKETHPYDRWPAYLNTGQTPSDECLLLLPPDIHGFYLNEKKWVHLFVDCIHPVSWNKKAYERLVLPSQTKDLIRALVTVRTSQRGVKQGIGVSGKRTDITAGKGNGLIMLLHGGPGTGKTLTAESVAEIAEMPLYRVTCGDIGTSAEAIERYLNTVLHLGKIWNCVLLLDEADVFLEERSMADLKRNSLVSVFLRILEYYDGILILTSNRVGMFDEAFKSRIQVALHYESLNRSSRKRIWQNFIDMLEEDEEEVNFDEIKHHLDDLAGRELNGRQIRNVLTTARQLAIFRNERLDWEHLEQALSVSSDFSAYLKRMQGHTDDQRARDMKLR